MSKKNGVRFAVSLALSGLFLGLALRQVDGRQVAAALRQVHLGWVAAYTSTLVAVQGLRSVRWQILVQPFAPISHRQAFRISNVGNMLIMLLPLRLGEVARPYLMKQEAQASMSRSLGAVAVERVLDGLLVSLLFFATTWTLPPPYTVSAELRLGAQLALLLFAGACVALFLAARCRAWLFALLSKLGARSSPGLFARLTETLDAFLDGLRALPHGRAAAGLFASTLGYWAVNGLGLWCLCRAFGWDLPLSCGFVLMCVLVIGIMIPAGPGFLGTFQIAMVAGLSIFGIGKDAALAYSLLAHLINLAVVVAFGLPYLLGRRSVDVRGVVRASADAAAAPPPSLP